MKNTLIAIGIIFGLILVGFITKLIAFPVAIINNTLDTPREINNAVMNGENAIATYEWFKQQEADIQKIFVQEQICQTELDNWLETMPEDKKAWDRLDRDEYSRLRANVTAQKMMYNKAQSDYNAKASMVHKSIFKDNLPTNLSRSWYANKNLVFQ